MANLKRAYSELFWRIFRNINPEYELSCPPTDVKIWKKRLIQEKNFWSKRGSTERYVLRHSKLTFYYCTRREALIVSFVSHTPSEDT